MRVFVAIPLPQQISQAIHSNVEAWRKNLPFRRWVHPADYHLTLQFIGECTPDSEQTINQIVEKIASQHNPFHVHLDQPGTFGLQHAPRVFWLGIDGELEKLHQLHHDLSTALINEGMVQAKQEAFHPHITIARLYQGRTFAPFYTDEELAILRSYSWKVEKIVLFQTNFGQQPLYQARKRVALSTSQSIE